jgi:hypothetical protein
MAARKRQSLDPDLSTISHHMRDLGLAALTHANWHANYFSQSNAWWNELSVLQAAHAAEILIKARIAEVHPLLIFEQLPKATSPESFLSLRQVFEQARSLPFAELPDRLWAVTGQRLKDVELYRFFGRLRNAIQHFAVPEDVDVGDTTVEFIYGVIDPFINECWGLYAVDFNEDHEPYVYLVGSIVSRGVKFLVSPEMMDDFEYIDFKWPLDQPDYRAEMERRFKAARAATKRRSKNKGHSG